MYTLIFNYCFCIGDTYTTVSLIIPAIKGILWKLTDPVSGLEKKLKTSGGQLLLRDVLQLINEKLTIYKERTVSRVSTLLDARFKRQGFQHQKNYKGARDVLQNLVKVELERQNYSLRMTTPDSSAHSSRSEAPVLRDSIFSFMTDDVCETSIVTAADSIVLVNDYLKRRNIPKTENPILYLKNNFPQLLNLGKQYLQCPGSSVPCERLFSDCGQIITNRRN